MKITAILLALCLCSCSLNVDSLIEVNKYPVEAAVSEVTEGEPPFSPESEKYWLELAQN